MVFADVNRITNMTHGVNQRRITDLSSQPADEYFDQLCIVLVRVFPNTFAQLGAREDATRLPHQHLQQHYFPRRKLDSFRAPVNIVSGQVQGEITNAKVQSRLFRITSAQCIDASY